MADRKSTYDIETGAAGFKITKKTRDENDRSSDYEYFYFTNWQDASSWLGQEMYSISPTKEERDAQLKVWRDASYRPAGGADI